MSVAQRSNPTSINHIGSLLRAVSALESSGPVFTKLLSDQTPLPPQMGSPTVAVAAQKFLDRLCVAVDTNYLPDEKLPAAMAGANTTETDAETTDLSESIPPVPPASKIATAASAQAIPAASKPVQPVNTAALSQKASSMSPAAKRGLK